MCFMGGGGNERDGLRGNIFKIKLNNIKNSFKKLLICYWTYLIKILYKICILNKFKFIGIILIYFLLFFQKTQYTGNIRKQNKILPDFQLLYFKTEYKLIDSIIIHAYIFFSFLPHDSEI